MRAGSPRTEGQLGRAGPRPCRAALGLSEPLAASASEFLKTALSSHVSSPNTPPWNLSMCEKGYGGTPFWERENLCS